ncbi:pilin [Patescibacteria group bacterium]|nr:pilin [Patescibacteria group bacterium]MCL5010198.1 pilin [Patescibacteria group bacterium]
MDWGNCLFDQNGANVATLNCVKAVFYNVINYAFVFAGVAALVFVILSGIKFLTSGGDPKQVEGARQTMTYAIIGLVIILLSSAILNLIAGITGVACIDKFGFNTCK